MTFSWSAKNSELSCVIFLVMDWQRNIGTFEQSRVLIFLLKMHLWQQPGSNAENFPRNIAENHWVYFRVFEEYCGYLLTEVNTSLLFLHHIYFLSQNHSETRWAGNHSHYIWQLPRIAQHILHFKVLPQLIELYDSTWRRRRRLKNIENGRPMTTLLFLLRYVQFWLSFSEFVLLTIGVVYDMFIEM